MHRAQEPAQSLVHPVEHARGNGSGKGVEIFLVYGRDLRGIGNPAHLGRVERDLVE